MSCFFNMRPDKHRFLIQRQKWTPKDTKSVVKINPQITPPNPKQNKPRKHATLRIKCQPEVVVFLNAVFVVVVVVVVVVVFVAVVVVFMDFMM